MNSKNTKSRTPQTLTPKLALGPLLFLTLNSHALSLRENLLRFFNDQRPVLEHPNAMVLSLNEDLDRLNREISDYLARNSKLDPATCTYSLGADKTLGVFTGFPDRYAEWEGQKKAAYLASSDIANGRFSVGLYRTDKNIDKSPETESSNERTRGYEGLKKQLLLGYRARIERGLQPVGITLSVAWLEEVLFVDREEFATWVRQNLGIESARITDSKGGIEDKRVVFESEASKQAPMNASLLYREVQIRCQPKEVEVIIEWRDVTRYEDAKTQPAQKAPAGKK
jgi:hypothetical protein